MQCPANCSRCDPPPDSSETGCIKCVFGWVPDVDGNCIQCDDQTNCLDCDVSNTASCLRCIDGFSPDDNGACVADAWFR